MSRKRFLSILIWPAAMLLVIFTINAGFYAAAKPYIKEKIADQNTAQAALIPGAAIFSGGRLSAIFKERVDGAIELYRAGKVSKILVSGDNSTIFYNEVNPVRNYLLQKGIRDADIFLDHAGFDTYSAMYRARDIFKVKSVIISTQAFHLPRSVFIARALGLDAYGYRAGTGRVKIKNYARESLAAEKAFLDLLFHRVPKYLGDPMPII